MLENDKVKSWQNPPTMLQMLLSLLGVLLLLIGGIMRTDERITRLEWEQAQTAVTPKDFQVLKEQVAKHEFLNQESIDDRKNIHATVDNTLKLLADIQRSQVHIEDALGVKR